MEKKPGTQVDRDRFSTVSPTSIPTRVFILLSSPLLSPPFRLISVDRYLLRIILPGTNRPFQIYRTSRRVVVCPHGQRARTSAWSTPISHTTQLQTSISQKRERNERTTSRAQRGAPFPFLCLPPSPARVSLQMSFLFGTRPKKSRLLARSRPRPRTIRVRRPPHAKVRTPISNE